MSGHVKYICCDILRYLTFQLMFLRWHLKGLISTTIILLLHYLQRFKSVFCSRECSKLTLKIKICQVGKLKGLEVCEIYIDV